MHLDGSDADPEAMGNRLAVAPFRQLIEHVTLAPAQRERPSGQVCRNGWLAWSFDTEGDWRQSAKAYHCVSRETLLNRDMLLASDTESCGTLMPGATATTPRMRRRGFIIGLGVATLASLLAARAQRQPVMPVIGFLTSVSPRAIARRLQVFRQALEETGYVEGRNLAIEYRWADGDYGRLPALAEELTRLNVTVIVATGGTTTALAAKHATSIIPIVFAAGGDPAKSGPVASLNRPGGNITGVNVLASDLTAKRLELLEEVVPKATVIAMLTNRNSATAEVNAAAVKEAARRSGRQVVMVKAGAESEFETAFATLVQQQTGALLVDADPFFWTRGEALVALAARHAVPAIYSEAEFVAADGLASYGPSIADAYRQAGVYASRILRGEKPVDLPVMQLNKIELILNLKTAKALGLTISQSILARADEVIE
jgi:putative ABC transport system substrate-binding protein